MLPLQHLGDTDWTGAVALLIGVYTVIATTRQHFKERENYPVGAKGLVRETFDALLVIGSIWVVQFAMHATIGEDYAAAGVQLHAVLDCGHLGVAVRLVTKSLLRYWQ